MKISLKYHVLIRISLGTLHGMEADDAAGRTHLYIRKTLSGEIDPEPKAQLTAAQVDVFLNRPEEEKNLLLKELFIEKTERYTIPQDAKVECTDLQLIVPAYLNPFAQPIFEYRGEVIAPDALPEAIAWTTPGKIRLISSSVWGADRYITIQELYGKPYLRLLENPEVCIGLPYHLIGRHGYYLLSDLDSLQTTAPTTHLAPAILFSKHSNRIYSLLPAHFDVDLAVELGLSLLETALFVGCQHISWMPVRNGPEIYSIGPFSPFGNVAKVIALEICVLVQFGEDELDGHIFNPEAYPAFWSKYSGGRDSIGQYEFPGGSYITTIKFARYTITFGPGTCLTDEFSLRTILPLLYFSRLSGGSAYEAYMSLDIKHALRKVPGIETATVTYGAE